MLHLVDMLVFKNSSLPVGVGVFLRRENLVIAFVAAILDNTRCGGAGRAVVDKMALALSYPGALASKIQDGARLANGLR